MSSAATGPQPALELRGPYSLRTLLESDVEELHALAEYNREELARWLSWAQQPTLEATRDEVLRTLAQEASGGTVDRAIVLDGAIAGRVGLYLDHGNIAAAIGYWLDSRHRGRGVMTAAVAELTRFGFERFALRRIEIRTDVLNAASRAIPERLGFAFEGVLRQSYFIRKGHYSDDAIYSMLDSDPARRALSGIAPASER